jgi:hypothetical protein
MSSEAQRLRDTVLSNAAEKPSEVRNRSASRKDSESARPKAASNNPFL